jgi:MFS family permease
MFTVYIVSLYQNLGLSGGMPLILGAAYVTVATLSNFLGALLLDKVGRKPLLSKCSGSGTMLWTRLIAP